MSGGFNGIYLRSAEIYIPESNTTCSLPPLPEARYRHTQDGGLACGGGRTTGAHRSCDQWTNGTWTRTTNLKASRYGHESWSTAEGVFLIGGDFNALTSELVKEDGSVEGWGFAPRYFTQYNYNSIIATDIYHYLC